MRASLSNGEGNFIKQHGDHVTAIYIDVYHTIWRKIFPKLVESIELRSSHSLCHTKRNSVVVVLMEMAN